MALIYGLQRQSNPTGKELFDEILCLKNITGITGTFNGLGSSQFAFADRKTPIDYVVNNFDPSYYNIDRIII